ncbi:MAG: hypothetical protein JSS56_25020, partial [Proteobacteria bacterium]|nr:hypothetical protein [Pseudomonadota bacterium]
IMLVLITLTVIAAFTLSQGNLKAVGNIQVRNEAVAAANRAIEEVVTALLPATALMTTPVGTTSNVDINNDGTIDYYVQVLAPACVRVAKVTATGTGTAGPGGIGGGQTSSTVKTGSGIVGVGDGSTGTGTGTGSTCTSFCGSPDQYFSVWDITASVADAQTGASTTIRDGVRVLLNVDQAKKFCGVT